ncbi:MAG: bifunctional folylpolyglutamate synthase/dihydrofolate synthase [Candidatus Latescibacteria bacterium]|nr:bifunctional folylpolyglutamate synthase/dihydrofolate synthase [Candidatus Latescibacterota bacterium]
MIYSDTLNYLYSFIDYEKVARYDYNHRAMNIEREVALLDLLGNPHRTLKCIHIAGSKGKGSTAAMVDAILRAARYRVGLYTSPHLVDFRERIRVNGELIAEEAICEGVEALCPCIERMKEDSTLRGMTFWEVWTALAFYYFARVKVDYAVIEVGLGGRLDATNVIHPLVAAITTLGMDHTDKLGDTLRKIAEEKAGIIKEGVDTVSSPQIEEGREVIRRVCRERHARLVEVGNDVRFKRLKGTVKGEVFDVEGPYGVHQRLRVPLIGTHQTTNGATAVTVVDLLKIKGVEIPEQAIDRGLQTTVWPGRFQVVGERPTIVLDGAHSPESAARLRETICETFHDRKVILIFGMNIDKRIDATWRELADLPGIIILTRVDLPRAAPPDHLREAIGEIAREVVTTQDVSTALVAARKYAGPDDLILVTGSLYVVGDAMKVLGVIPFENDAPPPPP